MKKTIILFLLVMFTSFGVLNFNVFLQGTTNPEDMPVEFLEKEEEEKLAELITLENEIEKLFNNIKKSKYKNYTNYKNLVNYVDNLTKTTENVDSEGNVKKYDDIRNLKLPEDFKNILKNLEENNTSDESNTNWGNYDNDLKKLQNLMEKVLENPSKELRYSVPSGGILPGSRKISGGEYVEKKVIPKLINTGIVLALSGSVLMLVIGGFMYTFGAEDEEVKKKAKNIIIWAIVGTIICVLAYTIVKLVINIDFG